MAKKVQLPVIGGIRKVITPGGNTAVGTTIAELGSNTVTLAALAALLGVTPAGSGTIAPGGGAGVPASLIVGPGLSGGGALLGAVPLNLTAPIPSFVFEEGGSDGDIGPPGINGVIGRDGAQGAAIFMAAENGEDGWPAIPGRDGALGATGAVGPIGPAVFFLAEDGPEGELGPPGPATASLTVTDGTHSVPLVTQVTVSGAVVSGAPPNALITISGNTPALPGTIPDLVAWWESDDILAASGAQIFRLRERTPWISGVLAGSAFSITPVGATIDASPINSLPTLAWGAAASVYPINNPFLLTGGATFFVVCRPNSAVVTSPEAFIGGLASGLAFYLISVAGAAKIGLVKSNVAVIGSATNAWASGVAFQANATYIASTGAFAFRQGRTANGSGTGLTAAGTGATQWVGGDVTASGGNLKNCSVAALIVYNRVLSPTEITNIENYLFTKWGV